MVYLSAVEKDYLPIFAEWYELKRFQNIRFRDHSLIYQSLNNKEGHSFLQSMKHTITKL